MQFCTKCFREIMYNELTQLWEDEEVLLCAKGPSPFKHVPPFAAGESPEPVYNGYGFPRAI